MYTPLILTRGDPSSPESADVRINVFTRGSDGCLWQRYWNGATWKWTNHAKGVIGEPVAHMRGNTHGLDDSKVQINLFVTCADNRLWELFWNGATWTWASTGKVVAPAARPLIFARGDLASPNPAGVRINVFVRGMDGNLWERYWNGATWTWTSHAKLIAGDPAAHVRGTSNLVEAAQLRVNLFVMGADGKVWERWWDGANWYWQDTSA